MKSLLKKIVCIILFSMPPIQVFAEAINYKCSARFGYWGAISTKEDAVFRVDCSDDNRHILCFNYQVKIIDDYLFFGDFAPVKLEDIGSNSYYAHPHVARREGFSQFRTYTLRINNDGSASIDMRLHRTGQSTAREYVSESVSFLDCKRQ